MKRRNFVQMMVGVLVAPKVIPSSIDDLERRIWALAQEAYKIKPELMLADLVSVQPMGNPDGSIFKLDLVYNRTERLSLEEQKARGYCMELAKKQPSPIRKVRGQTKFPTILDDHDFIPAV